MIKGHTKIELTNVKTGQKKVVEDTNMLTNGMSNFMMSNPFNNLPISVGYKPFTDNTPRSYQLCGGLLLFDKPIEENPDMIFPPAGHKMIGNAVAGISSTVDVPEFGYFDAPSSTFEYSGDTTTQKFVFDFGTSQGNGQISSVCLASLLAGYMGFGNHSGKRTEEKIGNLAFDHSNYFNPFSSYYIGHSNKTQFYVPYRRNDELNESGIPFLVDYKKNCMYVAHGCAFYYGSSTSKDEHFSTGTLKLQKYYFPLSSLNPLHSLVSDYQSYLNYQKYTVSIPSEITALATNITYYRNQVFNGYDGTYLIVGNRDAYYLEPNDTIYVLHVNADLEAKLYTVKNTTGKRIRNVYTRWYSQYRDDNMAVKDGYLFCQSYITSSTDAIEFFKIKLTDSTDVVSLGTVTNAKLNTNSPMSFSLLSNRLFIHNHMTGATNSTSSNLYAERIIDDVENVILPVNTRFLRTNYHHIAICGCDFLYFTMNYVAYSAGSNALSLEFNPMYLATINNLSEPVVKTSDLTMKITYTLTCTEEGDGQEAGDS